MWDQILLILVAGLIETAIYTSYLILMNTKKQHSSSILMTLYIFVYLWLLKYVIKEHDSYVLIATYAFACGAGNYLAMKVDSDFKQATKWWKRYSRRLWKK